MTDFETVPVGTMQRLKAVEEERDALAAHVERLIDAGCDMQDDYQMGEYSPHHGGIDAWADAVKDAPETSLARLKAEWQADALDDAADSCHEPAQSARGMHETGTWLRHMANELRRQAKDNTE